MEALLTLHMQQNYFILGHVHLISVLLSTICLHEWQCNKDLPHNIKFHCKDKNQY